MNKPYKILIISTYLILVLFPLDSISQAFSIVKYDSLKKCLEKELPDNIKLSVLCSMIKLLPAKDSNLFYDYYNAGVTLAQKTGANDSLLEIYNAAGIFYNNRGMKQHLKATGYYEKGVALAKQTGNVERQAYFLSCLAYTNRQMAQYAKAIEYYRQSLKIDVDSERKISTLGNMGTFCEELGDYPKGLEYWQQAIMIFQKTAVTNKKIDSNILVGLLISKGDIYVKTGQYDGAMSNYTDVLKIAPKMKTAQVMLEFSYTGIGKVKQLTGKYEEAIVYYNKALQISKNLETDIPETLNKLADVYVLKGDLQKATEDTKEAYEIFNKKITDKSLDRYLELAHTYLNFGKIYTMAHLYDKAVINLLNAQKLAVQCEATSYQSDIWQQLSKTYSLMRQPAKALEAYKSFIAMRDSVYSLQNAKAITRMEMQYDFDRKQIEDSIKQADKQKDFDLKMQNQHLQLQRSRIVTAGGLTALFLVLLLSFFIYRNYRQQKQANKDISMANRVVQSEKQKSDDLLLNILPIEVADELKATGKVHAKAYDNVTVMFTDFVQFTVAGEKFTPQQLVDELDTCFVAFDEIIGKHGIEKIKTVGDAYLAVAGLPLANAKHALDMVAAAIEIKDYMLKRRAEMGENTFEVRIGVHSGSVVAGIVGVKKFAYDIWGDAVNTAARMEQSGVPGKVNISDTTYELIKEVFPTTYRGQIDAKNKKGLKMYFVE